MDQPEIKQRLLDLCSKSAYPKAEQAPVQLLETHLSWVYLVAGRVYKLKKPVNFGFVDFRSVQARRLACEAEIDLNRRLAPDVYLGIRALYRSPGGQFSFVANGAVIDWAVYMRRLPEKARADLMLERDELQLEALDLLAQRIAAFHEHCVSDERISAFGLPEAISINVEENFQQTQDHIIKCITQEQAQSLQYWQREFLHKHHERLVQRVQDGYVRDGHGDLRLEHAYLLEGEWTVIDCIEFNERFRYADTCADVAFLSMDLAAHGHVTFAERFVAQYASAAHDYGLYPLLDFYQSYRAFVRGKVVLLSNDQKDGIAPELLAQARHYFLLALVGGYKPLVPQRLLAVGGMIASGKSTLADRLSFELACPVVDADRTRKHLCGVKATDSLNEGLWTGAYEPAFSEQVYTRMLANARHVLGSGRSVVLDASFRNLAERKRAKALADELGVPFLFIEAQVPKAVAMQRLAAREEQGGVSDARVELYDSFEAAFEPVTEFAPPNHLKVNTTGSIEKTMAEIRPSVLE